MNAPATRLAIVDPVDAAWSAYAEHRAKESLDPALAEDPAHVAEAKRLHAIFTELYTDGASATVLPFRRMKG